MELLEAVVRWGYLVYMGRTEKLERRQNNEQILYIDDSKRIGSK